jgi:hypothetical protein
MEGLAREERARGSASSLELDVIRRLEPEEPECLGGRHRERREPLCVLALLDLFGGICFAKQLTIITTFAIVVSADKRCRGVVENPGYRLFGRRRVGSKDMPATHHQKHEGVDDECIP